MKPCNVDMNIFRKVDIKTKFAMVSADVYSSIIKYSAMPQFTWFNWREVKLNKTSVNKIGLQYFVIVQGTAVLLFLGTSST